MLNNTNQSPSVLGIWLYYAFLKKLIEESFCTEKYKTNFKISSLVEANDT